MNHRCAAIIAVLVAVSVAGACGGGGSSPTTPPVTTPPPATQPPTTTPPVGALGCPLGKGTTDTTCYKASSSFEVQVEQAIDMLAQQKPQIFNLKDQQGTGGYLVLDTAAYYDGVVKNLQGMGLCAAVDFENLNIKNTNEFSDQYDILLGNGHARRGASTYRASCYPASFPVDPADVISYIRVAFYGFKCDAGVVPPPNADAKLPIGCEGLVTATPKDKDGKDVDVSITGTNIVWKLEAGKGIVDTDHFEGQPFNWTLVPRQLGGFSFCATLQGKTGCLNGTVIPNP
jgi:hypothetical protein